MHQPAFFVRLVVTTLVLTALLACDTPTRDTAVSPPLPDPTPELPADVAAMVAQIDTEVDPAFVYPFEQTKFVPPPGTTLLIMGQTLQAAEAFTSSFPDQPLPGGWAAYWGIPSAEGLATSAVNEHGDVHHHQGLADRFPNAVLQSALWMVGTWEVAARTAEGEFDGVIRAFSDWAKTVERPIYLRIGYEFDGPHNELEPDDYVAAYRRIVDITRREGVENVAFVWHSYGSPPYKGYPVSAWYPGDDYVDWVGLSLFGHMYASTLNAEAEAVFAFAKTHQKPVMVAETSPVHGISADTTAAWDDWFVNFLSLTYRKNVKAISFINADWSTYPLATSIGWRDARLQNNDLVAQAWFAETGGERYLKASPQLFDSLGYAP